MTSVELSHETKLRVATQFSGKDINTATRLLMEECGSNLPFFETISDPSEFDRIRFAALKVSNGNLELLIEAVILAQQDWRDLLVAAEFGDDVFAHEHWMPEKRTD